MGTGKAMKMKDIWKKLDLGMSKDEILAALGNPDSKKMRDGIETFTWINREFKGLLRGGSIDRRLTIEFQDGQVVGYDGDNMDALAL